MREEGGTAAIVEAVRAGLVMQLKEAVGAPAIMAREEKITRLVFFFQSNQNEYQYAFIYYNTQGNEEIVFSILNVTK